MEVHLLLLGCSTFYLARTILEYIKDNHGRQGLPPINKFNTGLHLVYTICPFPGGCIHLLLSTYGECATKGGLGRHEKVARGLLSDWTMQYTAAQIMDDADYNVKDLGQRVRWSAFGELAENLRLLS